MFEKSWKLKENSKDLPFNEILAEKEERAFDKILDLMGISEDEREDYLNPSLELLKSPFYLPDIDAAVDRIIEAIDNNEHIVIYGDYDTDGVTATAIFYDFLSRQLEADVEWMLPSRFDGGYGLSMQTIDNISATGCALLVTCDNGIAAHNEIEYANTLGIDVVVTDHHDIPKVLPECVAIVNPKIEGSLFTDEICGCGVVFYVVWAISNQLGLDDYLKYLPLAAIGTVGDVMKLRGQNRIIVKNGLELFKDSPIAAVRILNEEIAASGDVPNAGKIGYMISPLLNAAGRMQGPEEAVEFLLSAQDYEAREHLATLKELNAKRKAEEEKALKECTSGNKIITPEDSPIIVARGDDFHPGIVGILAGELVKKYDKPSIVVYLANENGEPVLIGSARSVDGIDIMQVFDASSEFFLKVGGHKKAAGFTLIEEKFDEFIKRTSDEVARIRSQLNVVPQKEALMYLPKELITFSMAEKIKRLEPTGEGNRMPIFYTDGVRSVYENRTPKVTKYTIGFDNGASLQGVCFKNDTVSGMTAAIKGGVLFALDINTYQNKKTLQLIIEDFVEDYNGKNELESAWKMTRAELSMTYKFLLNLGQKFEFADILKRKTALCLDDKIPADVKNGFSWFKIRYALAVFTELGFIKRTSKGTYEFAANPEKKDLSESATFRELGGDSNG